MKNKNIVFIATSIDGFIADKEGGLDWLHSIPNPDSNDMGYRELIDRVDALIMGRVTFETVCGFDCDWPYTKPVFVLSNSLKNIDEKYKDKVQLVNGDIKDVVKELNHKGFKSLYIDGGTTIQSFLKEDLIDEMIITTIPILLGGGFPLFNETPNKLSFELKESKVFLNQIVQNHFIRKK